MDFSQLLTIVTFAFMPLLAATAGSVVASFRPPGSTARSYVQHLAAGVVFSVVAVELLPEIVAKHQPVAVVIGFVLGVIAMFGIKHVAEGTGPKVSHGVAETTDGSTAMLWAIAVDILLDGMLIGVSFAEGAEAGRLLTIALAIELMSLALATTATLMKDGASRRSAVLTTVGLASLILVGSVIGFLVLAAVPATGLEVVLAFGLAALLYLVTEELLIEAHEEKETPMATMMFFVGFLVFLVLGML